MIYVMHASDGSVNYDSPPHLHRAEGSDDPWSCAAGGKAAPVGTTPRKDLLESGSISNLVTR